MTLFNKYVVLALTLISTSMLVQASNQAHYSPTTKQRSSRGFTLTEDRLTAIIIDLFDEALLDGNNIENKLYDNNKDANDTDYVALEFEICTLPSATTEGSPKKNSSFKKSVYSAQKNLSLLIAKLYIRRWEGITSLNFLQHPSLKRSTLPSLLQTLEVSKCNITILNVTVDTFSGYAIKALDLHKNLIRSVVNQGGRNPLNDLDRLNLNCNQIISLGEVFAQASSSLKVLNLQNNCLTSLPACCLSGLGDLEYLNLSNNLLNDAGLCVGSFAGIHADASKDLTIDMSNNLLEVFPPLQEIRDYLTELNLHGNALQSVSRKGYQLPKLRKLGLISYMRSSDLDELLVKKLVHRVNTEICTITVAPGFNDNYETA